MSKFIIANWKMNLNLAQSLKLAKEYGRLFSKKTANQVAVCPSFVALSGVRDLIGSQLELGAQDASDQPAGAHTGQIAAKDLADLGCRYVILGHSEQRVMGQSCRLVNAKLRAVLQTKKLIPIICVGEAWPVRQSGKSQSFVTGQVRRALAGIKTSQLIIIAYEPLWAIGSGKVISPKQAQEMQALIKKIASRLLGPKAQVAVIYGGSVEASNAASLLAQPEVAGLLVGGSSLRAKEFYRIAQAG